MSPYARRRYRPPSAPGMAGGPEDVVVYLEALGSATGSPPPSGPAAGPAISQKNRTIIPHLTIARAGDMIAFPNEDDVFHNLFSLSEGNRFNLGRYAPGLAPTRAFEEAGVVRMFCDIHSEMAGVILVLETPHFVKAEPGGSYRFPDVPPGRYRAVAWHPVATADTSYIEVVPGRDVEANFVLSAGR